MSAISTQEDIRRGYIMDLAIIRLKRKKVPGKGNTRSSSAVSGPSFEATSEAGADATDSISVSDRQAQILWKTDCKQVQHRQQSKIAPQQWMVSQNCACVHDFELHLSHGNRRFDSKSRRQKQASNKHKGHCFSAARVRLVDKFRDVHSVEEEDGESEGLDENIKIFERLLQRSALEEEVLLLHKRLEEELELHSVLETAVAHVPGTLTSFPYHLPIAAQELLADIAVLEVAVLKLKEKSTALRSQVVQEQTKREIAELHRERSGPILQPKGQGSPVPPPSPQQMIICADSQCNRPSHALVTPEQPEFLTATSVQDDKMFPCSPSAGHLWKEHQSSSHHKDLCLAIQETAEEDQLSLSHLQNLQHLNPLKDRQCQSAESCQRLKNLEEGKDHISPNGDNVQSLFSFHDRHSMKPSNIRHCLTPTGTDTCEYRLSGVLPAVIAEGPLHCLLSRSSSQEQEKCIVPVTTSLKLLHVKDVPSQSPPSNQIELWSFSSEDDHIAGSGFGLNTFTYEEQPWSQKAESASVDEQQSMYHTAVMKIQEERRRRFHRRHLHQSPALGPVRRLMGSGLQFCPVTSLTCTRTEGEDRREPSDLVKTPNQLSERMVHSMVSIYCHLAVQNVISGKSSPSGSIHSPTSPFGHQSNSSASSLSESSLVSFVRSPLVDLRNEEVILADATLDPFKVRNNIPWMDIGAYGHVFEVARLSLDEDQLNYVAQALQDFKLLVEQLASVDPSHLSHDEKLAFWINLYNTLMMDGYLTYGIPQSELKFFSLLQKVAYTVGGHLFSAAMIEYSLLKSKSSATHPQIMLSMALHRNKFTEARKFGIDRPEPLINFALCCGTWSAPMLRIYTAEKVHMQLEDAFHNYTQASVGISTTGKLLVPKLLQRYAQNFVEDSDLLDWICNLLPSSQVDVICECIQQQHHHIFGSSNITIVPFNFTFRYLFHADIARTLMSL